jgi:hypothetical protein
VALVPVRAWVAQAARVRGAAARVRARARSPTAAWALGTAASASSSAAGIGASAGSTGNSGGSGAASGGSLTSDAGVPPSCQPGGAGVTNCGASSENCCTSLEVEGRPARHFGPNILPRVSGFVAPGRHRQRQPPAAETGERAKKWSRLDLSRGRRTKPAAPPRC